MTKTNYDHYLDINVFVFLPFCCTFLLYHCARCDVGHALPASTNHWSTCAVLSDHNSINNNITTNRCILFVSVPCAHSHKCINELWHEIRNKCCTEYKLSLNSQVIRSDCFSFGLGCRWCLSILFFIKVKLRILQTSKMQQTFIAVILWSEVKMLTWVTLNDIKSGREFVYVDHIWSLKSRKHCQQLLTFPYLLGCYLILFLWDFLLSFFFLELSQRYRSLIFFVVRFVTVKHSSFRVD